MQAKPSASANQAPSSGAVLVQLLVQVDKSDLPAAMLAICKQPKLLTMGQCWCNLAPNSKAVLAHAGQTKLQAVALRHLRLLRGHC